MSSILPHDVVVEELWGNARIDPLLAQERVLAERMNSRRQQEFSAGRAVARRAVQRLGLEPLPLLKGANGAPLWQDGVVGSITHCEQYCAAAVASNSAYRGIGIDAEPNKPLPEEVRPFILHPYEVAWIASAPASAMSWDTMIFSAKEAFYKLWSSVTGFWCDFKDGYVQIDRAKRAFSLSFQDNGRMNRLTNCHSMSGMFHLSNGIILTTVVANW
ncbi:putative phosphopantetheinyl transferase PptA [Gluconacetobacter diazotrophicus PA1 5]|uniref:Enterobactin synthase component D n=2 Tax=Gluconacetobacter diazotrophicus TaxID=33996 RepID=A9HQP7_GLUDA|nr:putative phosphopantetheinyl transferase PptA [Gluconacetobacter diazotrophicus PA1 5]